ncbi:hypothetical protein ACLKA6_017643 [Drosophila palustris]
MSSRAIKKPRRSGVKERIRQRKSEIVRLLFKCATPPPWDTAVKLNDELEHLESLLKSTSTPCTSEINNKQSLKRNHRPAPKEITARPRRCPADCKGPLFSPHCKGTCQEQQSAKTNA